MHIPFISSLNQFGLVPAGLESATRKHQLQTDLCPPPFTHAALDVENAHPSIARAIVLWVSEGRFRSTKHPLDRLIFFYFLAYYSEAGPTKEGKGLSSTFSGTD